MYRSTLSEVASQNTAVAYYCERQSLELYVGCFNVFLEKLLPVIFNQNISIQNLQFVAEHHNVHSKALQIAKLAVKHIAQN